MRDTEWMDEADCKTVDVNVFFPTLHQGRSPKGGHKAVKEATAICDKCPVKRSCGEFIKSFPDHHRHGVWAGEHYTGVSHKGPVVFRVDGKEPTKHLGAAGTEARVREMTARLEETLRKKNNPWDSGDHEKLREMHGPALPRPEDTP